MILRRTSLLLLGIFVCLQSFGQGGEILDKKEIKQLERDGELFYEDQEYEKALRYFLQLHEIEPNNPYYNLVIGICYTYIPGAVDNSFPYLEKAKNLSPEFDQVDLYLGRAYYKNHDFQKAIEKLSELLAKEESDDDTESEARQIITYSKNALELVMDTAANSGVTNMGSIINSEDEEYVPIVTPDESKIIFTYRGKKSTGGKLNDKGEPDDDGNYFEDIFISLKSPDDWMYDEDVWLEPTGIAALNTDKDDACIALTIDGQTLFLYMHTEENGGDIYASHLDGENWQSPEPLKGEVNTKYWEGSVTISSDGKVIYFSSDRPEGYGGRDIYRAEKLEDGTWGNVTNLGPTINTALNDDSPFLHLDRKTLYFSSEGHNSIGGYDVFYSVNEDGLWSVPTNMGAPVNTTEDDLFYVATADGKKGYYSSAHGKGSQGRQDIYMVKPDIGRINLAPVAALIVGIVYADDVPTGSTINVNDLTKQETAGTFYSNSADGQYRIALLPGSKYQIEVEVPEYETHRDEIDLVTLKEYIEVSNNIYFYSEEFADSNPVQESQTLEEAKIESELAIAAVPVVIPKGKEEKIAQAEIPEAKQDEVAVAVPVPVPTPKDSPCDEMVDLSAFIGKDLNKVANYNKLLSAIGEYCADELEFRVQIGAYRFPKNFKYPYLNKFGEADVQDYPDGITRFTMGTFNTLKNADDHRQDIIKAGQKDAWVIPFYDGRRIFMEDLISVNFYKQDIN
ncbi:MAG: hypothetical protein RIC15_04505 [Vicingaceae bacterium]